MKSAFVSLAAFLTLLYVANLAGPPPPSVTALWITALIGAAILATSSLLLLSWAYARAETQILATTEYTGFLWAMLFGWYFYGEPVTLPTFIGALLIVAACLIVARKAPHGDPVDPAAA